jgi:diguanylate cyclase (GGDEF)-like protein/PAS domain S-box-containing protein
MTTARSPSRVRIVLRGQLRRLGQQLPKGGALPYEVWVRRHRGILALLWLHVPVLFAFSLSQHQSLEHSFTEAMTVGVLAVLALAFRENRRVSTVLTAVGLLTCSAVLVHLSHGVIEMHFHYFVMVGVVVLYQDWWPFLIAIGYVVLQHGVAGALSPGSVYNHQAAIDHPWRWAGVHGLFILGMSAAGIASWRLNESLLKDASDRQEKLAEAQEVARLGSWEWKITTGHVTWSDELYRLFGLAPGAMAPSNEAFYSRLHPDDRDTLAADLRRAADGESSFASDFRILLPDGATRWLHGRGEITEWGSGVPATMSGTAQDITDRKRAEAELYETLSLLGATLDSTADGILVVDSNGRITRVNRRFGEMWGLSESVLASRDDDQALAAVLEQLRDPEAFVSKVRELYAQPGAESHDVIEFNDGRVFERYSKPQRVHGAVVGRVWSFRDVTDHKRLENELAHQAFHDSLTDLANQALFRDRVGHALTRAARQPNRLAVLFLDLDNFKTVNDSLGHTAGDELLVAVAGRLQSCLRPADTAARLGGDEFAVLLEDLGSDEDASEVAERIIETLRVPLSISGKEIFVRASLGIAFDEEGTSADTLLRNADAAMYRAKREGKNGFRLFEPAMHSAAMARLELEGDLRRAIDNAEFVVHYQPTVSLASGRIVGFEALVRWQHPERGLIQPAEFIGLAEENGLIVEIGRWVLREACCRARNWQRAHPAQPFGIAVNLSARQLGDRHLVGDVAKALTDSGLAAADLTLEITETVLMDDPDVAIARLRELKALGVKLAIDDFGTGYSSLSSLQHLPVDTLKIDKAFIDDVAMGVEASGLVQAIIRLARILALQTVAEGVEQPEQAARLEELGCSLVQGYHFARPVPPEEVEALLVAGITQFPSLVNR